MQHAAPVRRNGPLSQCSGRYGIARIGIRLPTSGGSNAGDSPAAFDAGLARGRLRLESNGWKTGGERARQRQRQRHDTAAITISRIETAGSRCGPVSPEPNAGPVPPRWASVRDGACMDAMEYLFAALARRDSARRRHDCGSRSASTAGCRCRTRRRDKLRIAMSLPTKFAGSVAQFVDISATLTLGAGRGIAAPAFLARHAIPRSRPRPASIAAKRQRRQRSGGRRFTVDAARAAARSRAAGRSTDVG
ncbi:hypothetical protein [Burkholderia pseudomallei]|uniref:hypothetical protein n=1 Tax=Burkholderia pseudomallei TaxID=28450 RepID=UPI00217FB88C|nr:hypothetical protein [Burkholderia pseudomallei]